MELPQLSTNKDTPASSRTDVRTQKAEVHLNKIKIQRVFLCGKNYQMFFSVGAAGPHLFFLSIHHQETGDSAANQYD